MTAIYTIIYGLFLLFVFIACGFVVWHLLRYSLDQRLAKRTIIIFLTVTIILVGVNIYFFIQTPFDTLFTPLTPYNTPYL